MNLDDAMAAYKAAQAKVNSESVRLQGLFDALNAATADLNNGGTRVREGFVVSKKAMDVQNQQTSAVQQAQQAFDAQRIVVSQAYVDKDRAKQDLNNAVIASDQTGAVESAGPVATNI